MTFRLLALATQYQFDALVQIHLANYNTHRQLALDSNQPGEIIRHHRFEAAMARSRLETRCLWLLGEST